MVAMKRLGALLVIAAVATWLSLAALVTAPAGAAEVRDDVVCGDTAGSAGTVHQDVGQPVPAGMPPLVAPIPTLGGFEQIRSYLVDIAVRPDASMDVVETIEYEFPREPRRGIFRDFRLSQPCNEEWNRVYPLRRVSASSPTGAPTPWVREGIEGVGGGARLRIGDPDRTVSGVHTYVIRYRVDGVVSSFPDHEELYWNAIGPGWTVPVFNAVVRVKGPADPFRVACFSGPVGSTAPCDAANVSDGVAGFQETVLPTGAFTVAVAFPTGTFVEAPQYFEKRWSLARAFSLTPVTVGGSAALGAGVLAGVTALGFVVGRDRRLAGAPTDIAFAPAGSSGVPVPLFEDGSSPVEFAPPDGIRPAQLAVVRNEAVGNDDISATIVDLAVRGVVRIEESGGTKRRPDYRLVLLDRPTDGLLEYERSLITSLFPGMTREVQLGDLKDSFAGKLATVRGKVYDDAVGRDWFHQRPDKVKARWRGLGVLVFLVGAGLLAAAIAWSELALLPVPILVGGILIVVSAGRFPRRTPAGTGLRRRISGFELFMTDSEAPRARWAEQRGIFSEYLGYAIVLGITGRWAKTFEPLGAEAIAATTGWYVGREPFSFERFTSATDRFTSAAASTLASTPQSSSGSSGFSGGSSGGGGGGGGGGSW
jgi:hypothetical protein